MDEEIKAPNDEVRRLAEQLVAQEVAAMKEKLNEAYGRRDAAEKKAADQARQLREQELAAMEANGKAMEALQARLQDAEAARASLEAQLVTLTRDQEVGSLLDPAEFANSRSREIALREITSQLTKDESGRWVHRTGLDLRSFVTTFLKEPDNAFLLKSKTSTGAGVPSGKSGGTTQKRLTEMTSAELLEAAQQGLL